MVVAPILKMITKGVSTGMGLAGEKYSDHEERKMALSGQKVSGPTANVWDITDPSERGDEIAYEERIWALDEAAGLPSYDELQTSDLLSHWWQLRRATTRSTLTSPGEGCRW